MSAVLEVLDAAAVRRWSHAAAASVESHRSEIDRLNVFPVHDSDTGTNLATTLAAAAAMLDADPTDSAAEALRVLAHGAVLGASGNSGNIVAQVLRAFADTAAASGRCDGEMLRLGLHHAASTARTAVAEPVEGTILTVVAATAAAIPERAGTLAEVAGIALAAADDALGRTPDQLPVLARAGVVDAGGQGFVLLLEALVDVIGGAARDITPVPMAGPTQHSHRAHDSAAHHGDGAYGAGYEVQFLLDTDAARGDAPADELRAALLQLGDSVVVVGTVDGSVRTWSVHVHTDDAGAALEVGIAAGRPYRIAVSQLDDQRSGDQRSGDQRSGDQPKTGAVIAVAPGEGLGRLFENEGVHVVAGDAPSVEDVIAAALAADAREIVLLPNAARVAEVAQAAAARIRERGIRVAVVPTRSPVQGLAAVAVHDPSRRFDDDVVAMAEAAAATRYAEVSVAERESLTSAGIAQAGDVVGLIDGDVVEIGRGVLAVALAVVDRLLGVGAELMTVLIGAEAHPGTGDVVRRHVNDRSPLTEVTVYEVGQPRYPLIIGVE